MRNDNIKKLFSIIYLEKFEYINNENIYIYIYNRVFEKTKI